jgi:hypothetical protein
MMAKKIRTKILFTTFFLFSAVGLQAEIISTNSMSNADGYYTLEVESCEDKYCGNSYFYKEKVCSWAAPDLYEMLDIDLNKGAGGDYIYICGSRAQDDNWNRRVNDLRMVWRSSDPGFFWPFYTAADHCEEFLGGSDWEGDITDMNEDAGGNWLYLCWKEVWVDEPRAKWIGGVVATTASEAANWCLSQGATIVRDDDGAYADFNRGISGSPYIYVCTK